MTSVEELTVQVPWGQIAVKLWGPTADLKIMAVHGLNDNAASFDQLIPLLGGGLCVACVDLPGHGRSSPLPLGLLPSPLHLAWALRRVVDHFQWVRFDLLAHSMGGHVAVYLSALFATSITRVCLIDGFFAHVIPEGDFVLERCQVVLDKLLRHESQTNKHLYTYEESLSKLCRDRQTNLGIESIRALQKRAFSKTTNGYVYNNDSRMKLLTYPLITLDFHLGLIRRMDCRLLMISTSQFEPFLSTPATKRSLVELQQTLGSRMQTVRVQGSHDVHMDQPLNLVPIIKQFFSCQKCLL
ncbi:Serine hydrolase-like protein 2 [Homalodisca vitripennis]|nr:Serine hydrolase-like protein 2 [Homalodisca vitripennis]